MAGYSKKLLIDKLGITSGTKIFVTGEPQSYWTELHKLPSETKVLKKLSSSQDFIHYFTNKKDQLLKLFPNLKKNLAPHGILWISWPKKAAKVKTDLDEHMVRSIGLKNGLVDVKVCAVDEVWSGLKFVYRLEDR